MSDSDVTVVIPSRNRREDLVATLETVVASDHPDLTVAVFDNCSQDGTFEAVRERFGDRVMVARSPRPLAMVDSFEAAYRMAETTWVLGIGSDDGLHPGAISGLLHLASAHGLPAATAARAAYYWPGVLREAPGGELRVPAVRPHEIVTSRRVIRDVLMGRRKWYALPTGYFGLVHREVLESIRRRHGRLFTSVTPDVGLNFTVAREVDEYVICGQPLLVAGSSGSSNGASQFGIGDPSIVDAFWDDNARTDVALHPRIAAVDPRLPASMRVICLEAFLQAGPPASTMERVISSGLAQAWLESLTQPDLDDWWRGFVAASTGPLGPQVGWTALRSTAAAWRSASQARRYVRAGVGRVLGGIGRPSPSPIPKHALRVQGIGSLQAAIECLALFLRDEASAANGR